MQFPRAAIFYVYKRAPKAFCVHTGLYKFFLGYNVRSEKLYQKYSQSHRQHQGEGKSMRGSRPRGREPWKSKDRHYAAPR